MKKIYAILLSSLLVLGGFYVYDRKNSEIDLPLLPEPNVETANDINIQKQGLEQKQPNPTPVSTPTKTSSPTEAMKSQGTFSSGEELDAPDILVVQVEYNGTEFVPKTVDIKIGDVVVFKNMFNVTMWPASAPHPEHSNYPEFDSKSGIASGNKWQFRFEKPGKWEYHDHFNPATQGTVNVAK